VQTHVARFNVPERRRRICHGPVSAVRI